MTTSINKQRQGHDDILENVTADNAGPNSDGSVDAGLLVIASSATTSNPGVQGFVVAGAASPVVLGVTARKTVSVAAQQLTGTDGDGFPFASPDSLNELTAVWKGCVVPVTYTAAAVAYGAKLQSAANGEVAAYSDASGAGDPEMIVGECRVVGGMGSGGGVGLAYIY